ncbi:MAG: hypothetical protein ACPLRZ_05005 [Thermovenabulum sp.]|uniref:hypothetical protein n=1 Tax=Thermovenabulum sp. TaxID=3100335 RepID=UPI003C7CF16E
MSYKCKFLQLHKTILLIDTECRIYKCLLGNALLREKDLHEKWACKRCKVKDLYDKVCVNLIPQKEFIKRGISETWFFCNLMNIRFKEPEEFCLRYCKYRKN